jgi:two-component system, cell cycle response regulator DivK
VTLVAVVDDNADSRLLVDAILGGAYEVRGYASGPEALAAFAERAPGVVLLDISVPGMSGPELLARLRADPRLRHVPAIALTAHATAGARERYLAAGFDGYVAKPIVDETQLIRAVERALDGAPRR